MSSINTEVPSEDTLTEVCDYCEQPFATAERLVLHKGLEHSRMLTELEQEAFLTVRADEEDDLRLLRLKALGMLVVVYFGFLFLYVIFA